MLKVVGASWWQTRVSSYILGSMGIFSVFVLILGEVGSRVENDGNYSATVFWSPTSRYRMEFWGQSNILEQIPMGAARAYYRPDRETTGWSIMEIETNKHYPDSIQAYAAGLLEGSLTWQTIYWHWQNTVEKTCENLGETCNNIRNYLHSNSEWVRNMSTERSESDAFWHQIRLFYLQIDGIENGFKHAVKRNRQTVDIPSIDFLWMNCDSDLLELIQKFKGVESFTSYKQPSISTSLMKLLWKRPNDAKVIVSHNTEGQYGKMLRILKRYKFNYHMTATHGSKSIPGKDIVFTGYPASVSSQDDLYTISSSDRNEHNMIVTGTLLRNYNPKTWNLLNYEDQVLIGPRVMAANRLASEGRMWSRYIHRGNSGTGNKQWQIVNLVRLRNINIFEHTVQGVLWIVEQMPGVTHGTDQTHAFLKQTYWASYGLPHYEIIKKASNTTEMKEKYGSLFSQTHSPLTNLFGACKLNCTSTKEIKELMQNKVPFSGYQLGSRGDLLPVPEPSGIIDNKIVTGSHDGIKSFEAYSGPLFTKNPNAIEHFIDTELNYYEGKSNDDVTPFRWSLGQFKDTNHFGQSDSLAFNALQPNWIWI